MNNRLNFNRFFFALGTILVIFLMSCAIFPGRSTRDRAMKDQERIINKAASDFRSREKAHHKMQPKNTQKNDKEKQKLH